MYVPDGPDADEVTTKTDPDDAPDGETLGDGDGESVGVGDGDDESVGVGVGVGKTTVRAAASRAIVGASVDDWVRDAVAKSVGD